LGDALLTRAAELLAGYSNLEVDLASGARGRRDALLAPLLRELTGAEDATVVNNNAAAVLLALRALADGGAAAVARSQLVEIGGAFRLPEVIAAGGVRLMAVGTVNRVRREDYEEALAAGAGVVVLAHRSNFYFVGEYYEPPLADVVAAARAAGKPVLYDLGSGLLNGELYAGVIPATEPTVTAALAAGVDVVTFSGDKLLGGPQAGVAVGKAAAVDRMRREAMYRSLRVGKETYALLTATLEAYRAGGRGLEKIPTYRLLKRDAAAVRRLAEEVLSQVRRAAAPGLGCDLEEDESFVGGGTLPALRLPTTVVALRHERLAPHAVSAALRRLEPPVLARATGDAVQLDPRSLLEDDVPALARALGGLGAALAATGP